MIGNHVWGNPPRVRIPPSPLASTPQIRSLGFMPRATVSPPTPPGPEGSNGNGELGARGTLLSSARLRRGRAGPAANHGCASPNPASSSLTAAISASNSAPASAYNTSRRRPESRAERPASRAAHHVRVRQRRQGPRLFGHARGRLRHQRPQLVDRNSAIEFEVVGRNNDTERTRRALP